MAWRALPHQSLVARFSLALPLMLAACVKNEPVALSTRYQPPSATAKPAASGGGPVCRVQLGEVVDKRSDAESMGTIGGRAVRAVDSAAWVRSGLESLGGDGSITLVDATPDLMLQTELLKGYVMSMTTAKTTDVVLRIHTSLRGGPATEQIYRGSDATMNWSSGDGETQSALNRALGQALAQLRKDVLESCAAGVKG